MPYNNPDNQRLVREGDKKASQDIYSVFVCAKFAFNWEYEIPPYTQRFFTVIGGESDGSTLSEASVMKMLIKRFYKKESL